MITQIFRIIDSNCNRIAEGLRFLEDTARFVLNDIDLNQQIKELRHRLVKTLSKLDIGLLTGRDVSGDVGSNFDITNTKDMSSLVHANSKRVEQALRVIEELCKLPELSQILNSEDYKKARFTVYSMEQILVSKISRRDKIIGLTGLYAVLDTNVLGRRNNLASAQAAIKGGARIIQLRDKYSEKSELLALAKELKTLCSENKVIFIVNDHIDIAIASNSDGLHIGQKDLPVKVARNMLPINKIIGCSIENVDQALKAEDDGADYIALGSIFPTLSKEQVKIVGIDELKRVQAAVSIPVVAIGGINQNNILEILQSGVNCIALISAIFSQDNIEITTREIVSKIEQETKTK